MVLELGDDTTNVNRRNETQLSCIQEAVRMRTAIVIELSSESVPRWPYYLNEFVQWSTVPAHNRPTIITLNSLTVTSIQSFGELFAGTSIQHLCLMRLKWKQSTKEDVPLEPHMFHKLSEIQIYSDAQEVSDHCGRNCHGTSCRLT